MARLERDSREDRAKVMRLNAVADQVSFSSFSSFRVRNLNFQGRARNGNDAGGEHGAQARV